MFDQTDVVCENTECCDGDEGSGFEWNWAFVCYLYICSDK